MRTLPWNPNSPVINTVIKPFLTVHLSRDRVSSVSMSAAEEAEVASAMPVDPAPAEPAVAETQPQKPPKEKKPKAPKEKKKKKPKEGPSHPPYFQMIKEALVALQEKSGSSSYAIAKYMEEKHKAVLPANYKKMLALQLKNFTAKGKLIKIKASFKLSELGKKEKVVNGKEEKKPKKTSGVAARTRSGKKPATRAVKVVKKVGGRKGRKSGAVKPKQPKSIRSPVAKRARKTAV